MTQTPDLVILNGHVLTMDPDHPRAEALALVGDRLVAVGSSDAIAALAGEETRVVDAGGRTVLPGLIDSHVHLFQGAAELDFLPLGGHTDLAAVRPLVAEYAAARPDEPLVLGVGGFYDLFLGQTEPPRRLLDDILADRPFAILAADLHTVWANTRALQAAGLSQGAPMPEGSIVVMGEDGLATGTLFETGAFGPVLALSRTGGRDMLGYVSGRDPEPPATEAQRAADKALLLKGLDHCAAHGITSLHNMDGNFYQLDLLTELEAEGRLKCRVQVPLHLKNFDGLDRLEVAAEMHRRYHSPMVKSGRVKMFMDGVMESRTALMTRPYPDTPGNVGEAIFDPEVFNQACILTDAMGLQLSVHAVGDLAVRRVLDGFEAAQKANGPRDSRHRVEHIELITAEDLARLKALGAVASMQPRHASPAGFFAPPAPDTVFFEDDYRRAYAWKWIREAGVPLIFSTDWPVVPVSALASIQAAIAPLDLGPLWGDRRQGLLETLESYTRMNAWVEFAEDEKGMLRPGYLADIVILGGDIEATPPDQVGGLGIGMTICAGRVTYEAGA
jgi:predicted amidohydrolase YtcJ